MGNNSNIDLLSFKSVKNLIRNAFLEAGAALCYNFYNQRILKSKQQMAPVVKEVRGGGTNDGLVQVHSAPVFVPITVLCVAVLEVEYNTCNTWC